MPTTADAVKRMTEQSLKIRLYIAVQYPLASETEMLDCMADHLDYMAQHEDKIFLSGPLEQAGATVAEGLTILKTTDEAEAKALMDAEPFIKKGLRRYELKLWRIQEGSLSVTISAMNGTARLA